LLAWDIYAESFAEGIRDNRFHTEIITTVGRALDNQDSNMRCNAVEIFTAAIAQSALAGDIHTEIFAEALRDKIFNHEIVAALGRRLGDTDSNVRSSAVNFFTAATAQGAAHWFHRTFMLKSSQLVLNAR